MFLIYSLIFTVFWTFFGCFFKVLQQFDSLVQFGFKRKCKAASNAGFMSVIVSETDKWNTTWDQYCKEINISYL